MIGISDDGALIATGTENLVYFVDSATMKISGEPIKHHGVTSIVFSPTDDLAVLRSNDGTAKFMNPVTREIIASVNLKLSESHMGYSVFTQDGARVALVSPIQSRIEIFDTRTRKTLRTSQIHEQMVSLFMPTCFLPDGKSLASLTVSPDPDVEFRNRHHIDIQDVVTGDRIRRLKGKLEYPSAVACSRQGDLIAIADNVNRESGKTPFHSKIIRVYSTTTGRRLTSLKGHKDNIRTLQFSPNGTRLYSTRLYSTSHDTNVVIWDMTSARARIPQD